MAENNTEKFWNITVADGQTAPSSTLDEETRTKIDASITSPPEAGAEMKGRCTPADLARPWRDYQVQSCARPHRLLALRLLPKISIAAGQG